MDKQKLPSAYLNMEMSTAGSSLIMNGVKPYVPPTSILSSAIVRFVFYSSFSLDALPNSYKTTIMSLHVINICMVFLSEMRLKIRLRQLV